MPPKKKVKKITINKEINDILTKHFGGKISLIKGSKLTKLYDDGLITNQVMKFLKAVRMAYNKSERGDYELKIKYDLSEPEPEPDNEPQEDDPTDDGEAKEQPQLDLVDGSEGYSPDSPRYDEQGQPLPYDDIEQGKYIDEIKQSKYIVPHRKAFVEFINDGFYREVLRETQDSELNVYQVLVKEYLSIDTPYRGLLVYHGLGTGKTATAVSMAESVSSEMDIVTMLPASLENNFVGEVKRWGKKELDIQGNRWTFTSLSKIEDNASIRKKLKKELNLTVDSINQIYNHIVREVKKKISLKVIEEDPDIRNRKSDLRKKVNELFKKQKQKVDNVKGVWMIDSSGVNYDDMDIYNQLSLDCQIHKLVQIKYNFIHYNPLPSILPSDTENLQDDSEDEDDLFKEDIPNKRTNQAIKQGLLKDMKYNIKNYNVDSPFFNKTVIIDEVHNFVREILNNSGSARTFYEWIIDAQNVKLVFLSGTPIINKPCEIAVLYNMLKGRIKVYTITIKKDEDPASITEKLNELFYKEESPIELFHVSRKEGRLIISFTKHDEKFVSLMNPDNQVVYTSAEHKYSYKQFIGEIYSKLTQVFDEQDILPSKKDALSVEKDEFKVFDEIVNIPFIRKQTLFEIKQNDEMIDLTNNESFMDYFFLESYDIDDKKKVLLRRMLMGLTSYYPIDRSKIGSMPTIVTPNITKEYSNYIISKNINIEPCVMSSTQFSKYVEVWRSEKKKDLIRQMRRHLHEEIPFDFNIRTRQNCNIVYKDDEFRYIRDSDRAYIDKIKQYDIMKQLNILKYDSQLQEVSPKIYRLMTNINKFMNDKQPTGKVLIYSDFRGDSGAEIIEETLKANGYALYDPNNPSTKSLKYTFITGEESPEQRRINQDAFNDDDNKFGEFIQVMIISGAGAEGISLTCVRQVHILEPYWNFVRIDQVFGRAIRLNSHDSLDMKDRNVEEYLYLSVLPSGQTIEEIYQSIKQWSSIPELKDVKKELSESKHKEVKDTIDMIQNIGQTIDQKIFDMMEKKYKVSKNIIDIIKESSLDCIQHTRDDPQLNDRCIRFSNQLLHEIAYFPGISASELFEIDKKQLKAGFIQFIKPNHYVISGGDNEYIYYEVKEEIKNIDVRYIRENATKVCELSLNDMSIYMYVDKEHDLNKELGKQFSVYQDIFPLDKFYNDILGIKTTEIKDDDEQEEPEVRKPKFPTIENILKQGAIGYKIKYNINEMLFYSPNEQDKLLRLYRFEQYLEKTYEKPLILCNEEVYIQD